MPQSVEAELTAAERVPHCCRAEASQPSWDAVVSIPSEAAGTSEEQGQRWWCGELSPSVWTTDGIQVPWQSVEATPVDASRSWTKPQGSSRLWGWEHRTRHRRLSDPAPALPLHRPAGALLSLGSAKQVTAAVLLPRDDGCTGQELFGATALLILTHAGC